jgi:hypothetical protein
LGEDINLLVMSEAGNGFYKDWFKMGYLPGECGVGVWLNCWCWLVANGEGYGGD